MKPSTLRPPPFCQDSSQKARSKGHRRQFKIVVAACAPDASLHLLCCMPNDRTVALLSCPLSDLLRHCGGFQLNALAICDWPTELAECWRPQGTWCPHSGTVSPYMLQAPRQLFGKAEPGGASARSLQLRPLKARG